MKKKFLIIFTALFLFSCSSEKPEKPEVFLEEKEFTDLLTEIHLSDAVAEEKGKGDANVEQLIAAKGTEQILKNKHLSQEQFDTIFSYYMNQPLLMKKIYTEVLTRLSRKQAELAR